jgi:cell division protein ZapA
MAAKSITSLQVEIFGSTYRVRGEQGGEHLQRLAEIVDRKMRDIGGQLPSVPDSGKIAVLAALNLADDLLQCQQQQEGEGTQIKETVIALTEELGQALEA